MNRIMKAAIGAAAVILLTAAPALAWHGVDSGYATCSQDGQFTIVYTIDSWDPQHPGDVETRLGDGTTPITLTENIPGDSTSASLDWSMTWPDSEEHSTGTIVVGIEGTCSSPTPTPSESVSPTPTPSDSVTPTPPPTTSTTTSTPPPTSTHTRSPGGPSPTAQTGLDSTGTKAGIAVVLLLGLGILCLWMARNKYAD